MEYQFQLKQIDQERLFEALKSVRLGDSPEIVKTKLGTPDRERILSKFGVRSHIFTYYIRRVNVTNHNTNDQTIILTFDTDKRLERLGYSHIEPFFGEALSSGNWQEMNVFFAKPPAA